MRVILTPSYVLFCVVSDHWHKVIIYMYFQVECVFTRDIVSLCNANSFAQTTFARPPEGGYTTPVFLGGEHKIWGLTAVILHQTLNLLAPGVYKNKLRHPRTVGKASRQRVKTPPAVWQYYGSIGET